MSKRHCKKCGGTLFYQHAIGNYMIDTDTGEEGYADNMKYGRYYCDNCGANSRDLDELLTTEEQDANDLEERFKELRARLEIENEAE